MVHEGMISIDEVYKKTKLFDKSGVFGICKSELTKEEFTSFFKKESIVLFKGFVQFLLFKFKKTVVIKIKLHDNEK